MVFNIINSDSGIIYIAEEHDISVGFVLGNITAPFLKASAIKSIGQIELCWVEPNFRKKVLPVGYVLKLRNGLEMSV
jgi:hypothetical protein